MATGTREGWLWILVEDDLFERGRENGVHICMYCTHFLFLTDGQGSNIIAIALGSFCCFRTLAFDVRATPLVSSSVLLNHDVHVRRCLEFSIFLEYSIPVSARRTPIAV